MLKLKAHEEKVFLSKKRCSFVQLEKDVKHV